MVIAFIWSSGVVIENSSNNHYSRAYTEEYCNRFFSIASRAIFYTRIEKSNDIDGLTNMDGMSIDYCECINPMSIKGILSLKRNYKKLDEVLSKCDAAVINLPSLFIGKKAEEICEKKRIPYLVQLGGCPWDVLRNRGIFGKLCAFPAMIANKRDVKKAPAVIYVTQKFLQNRYPTKGKSIGCSNVALKKTNGKVLEKRLKKINEHSGKIVIGTAAAINVRYKGQQYVIKALAKLKQEGDDRFEYQIAGGGDPTYLNKLIAKYKLGDSVKIIGSLKHADVFGWLDTIDIYIQPSKTEGLPRALIEAMSRGVPSLGADSGGIPELINSSCIFHNGSGEVKAIINMLRNINRKSMLDMAVQNFNISKQYEADKLSELRNSFYKENLCK